MRRQLLTCSAIVLVALGVTACGGGSSDEDPEGNKVNKTTLQLGDAATLTGASDTYEVSYALDATEGKPGDLKDFRLEGDEAKMTPWYVRSTVSNDGGEITEDDAFGVAVDVLDDGGLDAKKLSLLGDFPSCELVNAPTPFPAGDGYESCSVYLVPEGSTLDKLVIEETKFDGANNEFTWKVS